MRKYQKRQLEELIELLKQAHIEIKNAINNNDIDTAKTLLVDCQNTAIAIGGSIDENEGENTATVSRLEIYCEVLFSIYNGLEEKYISCQEISDRLMKEYQEIVQTFNSEIKALKEAVFLPYKASMWDSLESVWQEKENDPEYYAVVIPIPYYDKNEDGTLGEYHYEGGEYPKNIQITAFDKYDFENIHPDEIYIHNPYDEYNKVTSIHPFFYSKNIKKYTDKLIYIPYFILTERNPMNIEAVRGIEHFIQTAAVLNADEVWVQSENMKQCYVEGMVDIAGEKTRSLWEHKIKGRVSPKLEKVKNTVRNDELLPEEWYKLIYTNDGKRKKVIFYNVSVVALLRNSELMISKIKSVLDYFETMTDNVMLWWRPHPLIEATLSSMRPELLDDYRHIVAEYKASGWGIYDDTADLNRAIAACDAYYGDHSSVLQLCKAVGKPIMIQNVFIKN